MFGKNLNNVYTVVQDGSSDDLYRTTVAYLVHLGRFVTHQVYPKDDEIEQLAILWDQSPYEVMSYYEARQLEITRLSDYLLVVSKDDNFPDWLKRQIYDAINNNVEVMYINGHKYDWYDHSEDDLDY